MGDFELDNLISQLFDRATLIDKAGYLVDTKIACLLRGIALTIRSLKAERDEAKAALAKTRKRGDRSAELRRSMLRIRRSLQDADPASSIDCTFCGTRTIRDGRFAHKPDCAALAAEMFLMDMAEARKGGSR